MKRYGILPALAVLALGACSAATRERPAGNAVTTIAGTSTADLAALESGQEIFEAVCTQCHTVQPPAGKAPPMSHVARHYRDTLPDRDQAIARITQWLRGPAAERSLLPAQAIEMWGLMPPLQLEARQVRAVAEFIWGLADQAMDEPMDMGGRGMQMGGGRGMQMGRDTMAGHQMMQGMGGGTEMMGGGRGRQMGGDTMPGHHMMQGMGAGQSMRMDRDSMTGQSMDMGHHMGMLHRMGQDSMTGNAMAPGMAHDRIMHMRHDTAHTASGTQPMGMGTMHRRGMVPPDTTTKKD